MIYIEAAVARTLEVKSYKVLQRQASTLADALFNRIKVRQHGLLGAMGGWRGQTMRL